MLDEGIENVPAQIEPRYGGGSFDACSEGLLLQISPWGFHMEKMTITRAQCLELNVMAERIAEWLIQGSPGGFAVIFGAHANPCACSLFRPPKMEVIDPT